MRRNSPAPGRYDPEVDRGSVAPERSPLADAVRRVGDRWTLLLIEALMRGPRRFNDVQEELRGIAPNVLSQRLKHLEREAIVVARPYSERPLRLEYELTAEGRELAGALRMLEHWGARRGESADAPRHAACGTPIEARWYCPTCARVVEDDEGEDLRFL